MARVALLIGTGDYTEGLKALPAVPKDVAAIATVLRDPKMGGFDEVQTLIDQSHATIAETIETWFRGCQKDDLALLYLSGHSVKDDRSDLYFAACNTRKQKEALVRSTAVAASFNLFSGSQALAWSPVGLMLAPKHPRSNLGLLQSESCQSRTPEPAILARIGYRKHFATIGTQNGT